MQWTRIVKVKRVAFNLKVSVTLPLRPSALASFTATSLFLYNFSTPVLSILLDAKESQVFTMFLARGFE